MFNDCFEGREVVAVDEGSWIENPDYFRITPVDWDGVGLRGLGKFFGQVAGSRTVLEGDHEPVFGLERDLVGHRSADIVAPLAAGGHRLVGGKQIEYAGSME